MSHWRRSRAPIWRCVRQFYTTLIERHAIYCWRPQSSKILFLAGLCSAAAADTSSYLFLLFLFVKSRYFFRFLAGLCSCAAHDTSSCLLSARPSGGWSSVLISCTNVNFSFLVAHLSFVKFCSQQLILASMWFHVIFMLTSHFCLPTFPL